MHHMPKDPSYVYPWAVGKLEWRAAESPSGHLHELEGVVLAEHFVIAHYIDLPVLLWAFQHLEGQKLFEVGDGGLG